MSRYTIIIPDVTLKKVEDYQNMIKSGEITPGKRLLEKSSTEKLKECSTNEFIKKLLNTKKPQIFAESEVYGDGRDWTCYELSILGDISISVPVHIYDNGLHVNPLVYRQTLKAHLIYTPGALLRNDLTKIVPDLEEVITDNQIDIFKYSNLYKRRLLAPLIHINTLMEECGQKAVITIPGLGCGQFAGRFAGILGPYLQDVIYQILKENYNKFLNIKTVYFDPYDECEEYISQIGHIEFIVKPLLLSEDGKPQLCRPEEYTSKDFCTIYKLFSFVAWDHVSWPGNDFYLGDRVTDDGVKAAATDSMYRITGIEGSYNPVTNTYDPPKEYKNWEDVVTKNHLDL